MPENIDIRYKPNPLLKNPIPPKQEFHEKIEEPIEVKQEDKTDTEPATIKVDPIKKTETLIKVEPIKPKKV